MDKITRVTPQDRADIFQQSANVRHISSPIVIEKDFWVCWALKELYALPNLREHIVFKGGTSLSKVFRTIERFSEDIDLVLDRDLLGLEEPDDIGSISGKKRDKFIKSIRPACYRYTEAKVFGPLRDSIASKLDHGDHWGLELHAESDGSPTIQFRYPSGVSQIAEGYGYVLPFVKLEIGARGELSPSNKYFITPYAAEDFPELFEEARCEVNALEVERTFWEKATLLHSEWHRPADKVLPQRLSRHCYDIHMIANSMHRNTAVEDLDLLHAVARHKSIYFPSSWSRYEEAKPGSLRLVPEGYRIRELEADYQKMGEMIFEEPPSFEEILDTLRALEEDINS